MKLKLFSTSYLTHKLWDLWCLLSVIGIWPRFIEPNLICLTKLPIAIPNLPLTLNGLRVLQFSDLHLNDQISDAFLERLSDRIQKLAPDLILFTGDFICYSSLEEPMRLQNFLCTLSAPYGCYAILGNHDYDQYVSINENGEYDIIDDDSSTISKGLLRLFESTSIKKTVTPRALKIGLKQDLLSLLKKTPFKLLHNESTLVPIKDTFLNICGLGEHMLGRFLPQQAFENYKKEYPGIILAHNPDGIPHLKGYPGELVLCGHTHGAQINLPWISEKCTLLENKELKRGLFQIDHKSVYVNRGVGSTIPFRWFSPPELLLLTLHTK